MSLNVNQARQWVRSAAKDAEDASQYTDAEIDRAILYAGNYFCRETRALKKAGTVSLVADSATFDFSALTDFRPDRLIDCYLSGEVNPLAVVDYPDLNAALAQDGGTDTGRPQLLAFLDWTTAAVWPTPDASYTAKLRYWLAFTTWTPGDSGAGSTVLNVPDDLLPNILADGAAAVLKFPSAEAAFASASWQRFAVWCERVKGAGNLGVRVIQRQRLDDTGRPPIERTAILRSVT